MSDFVGQQLGNYHLERLLARGGFGDIYLGEHIHLGTQAAIKVLNAQIVHEDIGQFRTEARTIARLIHPNIVRILEFGVEVSTPFLVMDYAPNGTLRQRHPKGTQVALDTCVGYVKQIADALQYAHDNKLIHRDVKPENMLVGRHDELLLSDFGIALIAQSTRYQGTQDMAGTIGYMAPEQIQAHPRPASDQYALGIVVYEWLIGERPFHGSFTEIAAKHAATPPPSLREKFPTISPDVDHVVMTALAKDPQQRFASVQAFAKALEQASQHGLETVISIQPHPQSLVPPHPAAPLKEVLLKDAQPLTPAHQESEASPAVDKPTEKSDSAAKLGEIVWTIRIGKPRLAPLLAALIGIVLFSLLISLSDPGFFANFFDLSSIGQPFAYFTTEGAHILSNGELGGLFETLGALVFFGFIEVIPLFFGAAFSWRVGLLTGCIGFLIGSYASFIFYFVSQGFYHNNAGDYFDYFNRYGLWFLLLYMIFIGCVAGLAAARTKGRYNTLHSLLLAYVFSFAGVIIGLCFIVITFDSIVLHDSFAWQQLLLFVLVLPGLTLLPFLLRAYDAVAERVRGRRYANR